MKVKLDVGQTYEISDQVGKHPTQTIIYLPKDSPNLMATEDEAGNKRFHDRKIIKQCIKLGLWKLREVE